MAQGYHSNQPKRPRNPFFSCFFFGGETRDTTSVMFDFPRHLFVNDEKAVPSTISQLDYKTEIGHCEPIALAVLCIGQNQADLPFA